MKKLYAKLAPFYDSLFFALDKDYMAESQKIDKLIQLYKKSAGNYLLDLGCGTGEHLKYLKKNYIAIGIDISRDMLDLAKQKSYEVPFVQMEMLNFRFNRKFDAVICLFSAIGYIVTKENLDIVVKNVSCHLKQGGVFIVEPWYSPDEIGGYLDLVEFGEKQGIRACRMRETKVSDRIAKSKSHILVSQNGHVLHHMSRHTFGLFSKNDFAQIFPKNELQMCTEKLDLSGRGLYLGIKEN